MKDNNNTKISSDKKSMGTFNKVGNAVERQKNREHKFAKKTYSAASKKAQKIAYFFAISSPTSRRV